MASYDAVKNKLNANPPKNNIINRANDIIDTPAEVAAVKAQRNDPIDTPEELQEDAENRRQFGPS
jgi:hypothetical protein